MRTPSVFMLVVSGLLMISVNPAPVAAQCSFCAACVNPLFIHTQTLSGTPILFVDIHCWQETAYVCENAIPCLGDDDDELLADLSSFIEQDDRHALQRLVEQHPQRFDAVPDRGLLLVRESCGLGYHSLREVSVAHLDIVRSVLDQLAWQVAASHALRSWAWAPASP